VSWRQKGRRRERAKGREGGGEKEIETMAGK